MKRRHLQLSAHAVLRFVQRCEPSLTLVEARIELESTLHRLVCVGQRSDGGDADLYRDPHRPMRAEVVVTRGCIVTVTSPQAQAQDAQHTDARVVRKR